jgi:peroxiredoxin Q/BCP
MSTLTPGTPAPDFNKTDGDGRPVTLAQYRGKQAVVLFFYPKDETAICTKEACAFRDAFTDFSTAGAAVIGVSADGAASHQSFAARLKLPFSLISDEDGALRKAYGVPKTLLILPGRTTFVIDRAGVIRHAFTAAFGSQSHVDEALAVVKSLPPG